MHPAYSVILFTTASGAGYGLLALLGLVGISHGQASSLAFGLIAMVIALGLITVGLLSSTFHLGHPERAWRAFSQWRSSWLSREGVAAVITYVPAVLFGAVWSGLVDAPAFIAPLGRHHRGHGAWSPCSAPARSIRHSPPSAPGTIRGPSRSISAFALATGAVILAAITAVFGNFPAFLVYFSRACWSLAAIVVLAYWRSIDAAPRDLHHRAMPQASARLGRVSQWELPHTSAPTTSRRRWAMRWRESTRPSSAAW